MSEFEARLPLINDIYVLLDRWQLQRETVSIAAISSALRRPVAEVIRVFQLLGLVPRRWSDPDQFAVADILESCSRHEVGNRYSRVESSQ
jgi:hypothetical protein